LARHEAEAKQRVAVEREPREAPGAGGATSLGEIRVERHEPGGSDEWAGFLARSCNGTLFHDLEFLAYHPPDRFETHHLVFRHGGEPVALLPAAIVREGDAPWLKSPYGGSVGGPALSAEPDLETTLTLLERLQLHVVETGLAGVEIRVPPSQYWTAPDDSLGFALAARGFELTRRWLCHMIPLSGDPAGLIERLPKRRRRYVRSAAGAGLQPEAAGPELLAPFHRLLEAHRAEYDAMPTHSLEELERIHRLVPERLRLFVCRMEGEIVAGILVFELNPRIANTFYLCHDRRFDSHRPATLITLHVAEHYAARGFRYLDMGPTTADDYYLNAGLARFKGEMGGVGLCRDTWRWRAPPEG
jgi:hypothetical protein